MLNKILSMEIKNKKKIITFLGIKISLKTSQLNAEEWKKYISNEIYVANIVKETHSKTFPPFKNIHEGKDIVIVATGPTMSYYKPMDAIHIGVNKAYKNKNINYDYLFVQDKNVGEECLNEIIQEPSIKFIGSVLNTKSAFIPMKYQNLKNINLYFSDYPRNLNLPYIEQCALMDYRSITFPAIQFALYTNPKRIYLVGCDCSSSGYFDGTKQKMNSAEHMIPGYYKIKEYQEQFYPETEIISINPVGLKNIFKDVYTENYKKEEE